MTSGIASSSGRRYEQSHIGTGSGLYVRISRCQARCIASASASADHCSSGLPTCSFFLLSQRSAVTLHPLHPPSPTVPYRTSRLAQLNDAAYFTISPLVSPSFYHGYLTSIHLYYTNSWFSASCIAEIVSISHPQVQRYVRSFKLTLPASER
jgi:hypothetical protein